MKVEYRFEQHRYFFLPTITTGADQITDDAEAEWKPAAKLGNLQAHGRNLCAIQTRHTSQQLHGLLQSKQLEFYFSCALKQAFDSGGNKLS